MQEGLDTLVGNYGVDAVRLLSLVVDGRYE